MGLCIYSDPDATRNTERYALMPSVQKEKKWSWTQFRKVDVSKDVVELIEIIEKVFESDKEIPTVTRHDEYPF